EMVMRLSIGIAAQAALEDTAENLMRNADLALNAAKTRGKGRYERYEPQQQAARSEEHTSELQSHSDLVGRLLLEKKKRQGTAQAQNSPPAHSQPDTAHTARG